MGVAIVRHGRRAAWLVACLVVLVGVGLFGFALLSRGDRTRANDARPAAPPPEIVPAAPADPDAPLHRGVLGTWTDNYRGKRTMTLKEDGTGVMVVELEGLSAAIFAERLEFEMVWSVDDGCLKKQTVGGKPAEKVDLILKTMGDRVAERIEQLTEDRLVLVDQDGETRYTWTRVR